MVLMCLCLRYYCFASCPVNFFSYLFADEIEFSFLKGHVPLLNNPPQPEDAEMVEEPEAMVVDPAPVGVGGGGQQLRANVNEPASAGLAG